MTCRLRTHTNSSLMDRANTTERQLGLLLTRSAKLASYAGLTDSGIVGPYNTATVLTFCRVFTNVGKAYSSTSGCFTAPLKGVYAFRFTVRGNMMEGVTMGAQLLHNGKAIVYNLRTSSTSLNHFEYLSSAVILELNVRDEVHSVPPGRRANLWQSQQSQHIHWLLGFQCGIQCNATKKTTGMEKKRLKIDILDANNIWKIKDWRIGFFFMPAYVLFFGDTFFSHCLSPTLKSLVFCPEDGSRRTPQASEAWGEIWGVMTCDVHGDVSFSAEGLSRSSESHLE